MTSRLALRDRLALAFALALVGVYALIAVCATVVVDRALSSSTDARLTTVAEAIFTIAGDARDEIDRKDRRQFADIVTESSGALVLDASGTIVLGTVGTVPAWVPGAVAAQTGTGVFSAGSGRNAVRAIVERRSSHDETNVIVVWQSMRLADDVEHVVGLAFAGFAIVVALGGFFIGAAIARGGLRPLTSIAGVIADIAAHDLSRRVGPQPHADELGALAATFDAMLDRLQAAFERQRRFTADASHDLRAPLATLLAEVELALRRERTPAEYREALRAIGDDADQLERLIDALLASARSEIGPLVLEPLAVDALVDESIAAIGSFADARGVAIVAELGAECRIRGEEDLLRRGILAILHNAVKFTPRGGTIRVVVAAGGDTVGIDVRDAGPGFTADALTHALDRFWRDDAARTRSTGSGLGLAIADDIVRRCGGTIALSNAPGGGANVHLAFPRLESPVAHTALR